MRQTQNVIKCLLKGLLLQLVEVFHFELEHFVLLHVSVANHVLADVDVLDRCVISYDLGNDKEVLRVKVAVM